MSLLPLEILSSLDIFDILSPSLLAIYVQFIFHAFLKMYAWNAEVLLSYFQYTWSYLEVSLASMIKLPMFYVQDS